MNDAVLERMARSAVKEVLDWLEEPTPGMIDAAVQKGEQNGYTDVVAIWKAMLAARRESTT